MLKTYVVGAGLPDIAPHDLRRTTAKVCRAAGRELEEIQVWLGHSSVQTTERHLGTKQDLAHAPNDAIKLKLAVQISTGRFRAESLEVIELERFEFAKAVESEFMGVTGDL